MNRWLFRILLVIILALALIPLVATAAAAESTGTTLTSRQEQYRQCVAHRESRNTPTARSSRSTAQGKYQFLDSRWRKPLSYMVSRELKRTGQYRAGYRAWLASRPIATWPERIQDVAFAAVLNARGPWSGAKHWHLPGSTCNQYVPGGN